MTTARTLYTAMMVLLAKVTDRELGRMVSYLKEENRILRARLPDRINVTPKERDRLLRFGRKLGKAIHRVVTITSPGTFLKWLRDERKTKPRKRGRPRTAEDLRELILKLAGENDWGQPVLTLGIERQVASHSRAAVVLRLTYILVRSKRCGGPELE
jgi:putative transposase